MQLLLKIIIVCKDKGQKQDKNTVGSTVIQKESSLVVSRRLKLSEIFVLFVFVLKNYDGLKAFIPFSTQSAVEMLMKQKRHNKSLKPAFCNISLASLAFIKYLYTLHKILNIFLLLINHSLFLQWAINRMAHSCYKKLQHC